MLKKSGESVMPIVLGIAFVLFIVVVMYYKDIVRWLYVRELWLLPIQIDY